MLFLSVLLCSLPAVAGTSPGKNSAFESASEVTLVTGFLPVLTAGIAKGKPKRVLTIEAALQVQGGAALPSMTVNVNGVAPDSQANPRAACFDGPCSLVGL